MQRAQIPVPDRLLPRRVPRHLRDQEVHLGEALAVLGGHRPFLLLPGFFRPPPRALLGPESGGSAAETGGRPEAWAVATASPASVVLYLCTRLLGLPGMV